MRDYIRENFHPDDRLAVVCKRDRVQQRIVTAEELSSQHFQSLLKIENSRGANVYVSMNTLRPDAQGRTKRDIAAIRHIYLDIDYNGRDALEQIIADADAPRPSYILNTSPDKFQVIWKVADFDSRHAEALQRAMAVRYGADRAATDVTRVLRIPGFTNQKYDTPYLVTAEKLSDQVYRPSDFRIERLYEHRPIPEQNPVNHTFSKSTGGNSQSERDWFETCRRIERGDNPGDVRNWLEQTRHDKSNPKYYAALTVSRALTHCAAKNKPSKNSRQEKESIVDNNVNTEKEYVIGHAPAGMGKELGKNGLGLKWSEDTGWHTADPEKAKAAHAKILEQQPRYYLEGNTYAVKDMIAQINKDADSPEKRISFDPYTKKQYARNPEVHEAVQPMIPPVKEKLYLEGDSRAIFAIKEQLKAITMPGADGKEVKTFTYDQNKGQWYTFNQDAFKRAQTALAEEMKNPRYQEAAKDHNPANDGEKHYIPNVPFALNKKMRELGCQWDPDAKSWYHTDPAKAKEAERLVTEAMGGGPSVVPAVVKEVTHEM